MTLLPKDETVAMGRLVQQLHRDITAPDDNEASFEWWAMIAEPSDIARVMTYMNEVVIAAMMVLLPTDQVISTDQILYLASSASDIARSHSGEFAAHSVSLWVRYLLSAYARRDYELAGSLLAQMRQSGRLAEVVRTFVLLTGLVCQEEWQVTRQTIQMRAMTLRHILFEVRRRLKDHEWSAEDLGTVADILHDTDDRINLAPPGDEWIGRNDAT